MLEKIVRLSLWITIPANLAAGLLMIFPELSIAQTLGFPSSAHPFYSTLAGGMVALFGGVYCWLVLQEELQTAVLVIGAAGKLIAGLLVVSLYAQGQIELLFTLLVSGDLVLAGLWFYFAATHARPPSEA